MKFELDGIIYDVVINKKNNKNLYVRVKEDMKIHVSCNYFTTKGMIEKVLNENKDSLRKMLNIAKNKNEKSSKFFVIIVSSLTIVPLISSLNIISYDFPK